MRGSAWRASLTIAALRSVLQPFPAVHPLSRSPSAPPLAMDADISMSDAAPSPSPTLSTAGLFKSKGKKGAARAANAAAGSDSAAAAASSAASTVAAAPAASSSSRRGLNARTASASRLSFDDAAEGEAEAASTGVDALALQIKLDKQKRLQAKKGARAAAAISEAAMHTPIAAAAAPTSAGLYTPEALAAMRNNHKSFSAAAAAAAHKASLPPEEDMAAMEPEANLAQLRRPPPAGSAMELGVGLGSGSFRASGRSKQIALQEADDLRRANKSMAAAAAAGSSARTAVAVDDSDAAAAMEDVEGAMTRAEELDQLAKERMVRAAKLQRQRMRATGQLGAGEIAAGQDNDDLLFIPLSQNELVPRSEDGGRLVQLDREYGLAVVDDDDDEHDSKSRLVRDDADDILVQEYDDAAVAGDRIAFGDPAARKSRPGVAKAGGSTQIGALLNKSTTRNGTSRQNALLVDDDDDDIDLPRSRRSRNAAADDDDGGMEDDEETRKWEEDLIRKGGGARAAKSAAAAAAKAAAAPARATTAASQPSLSLAQQIESSTAAVSAASGSALGLIDPADVLRSGLATQLSAMTASHDKLNSRFHNIEKALLAEQQEQKQIESNIEQANTHYVFCQQLTEQLITTLDCLSEKARDIQAAWDEMHALKRTRAQEIADAVQQHDNDLVDEAGLGGAKQLPQVDEFGRDLASVHESAAERRREARVVWLKQQLAASHPLGWHSFTSLVLQESEVGHARYDAAVASLLSDSTFIFSDTSAEFRTLDSIKALCEKWKRTHRDTYESAYIPDSMPIILAPYVSLELLQNWNLLRQPHFSEPHAATTPNGESKQGWYQKLFDYGMDASTVPADPSVVDGDSHLLPNLIESVLIPIVSSFVSIEFNVLSTTHCKALRECAQEVEAHLVDSTTSSQWKSLQNKILEIFSARIAAHQKAPGLVPTMESTSHAAAASPLLLAKQESLARYRFYRALHLLASLTSFQSLLPAAAVKQLASQHLVASLLPFLAWCAVQTDASMAAQGGEAAAMAHAMKMQADAAGSSSLLSASPVLSPLQHLLSMCTRFLAVFPQQWLAGQAQGAVTTSTSMTKLYDALNTLKQAADAHDQAKIHNTVKQMRTLLHR